MEAAPYNHTVRCQAYVVEQLDAGTRHKDECFVGCDILILGVTLLVEGCNTYAYSNKGIDSVSLPEIIVAGYAVSPSAVGLNANMAWIFLRVKISRCGIKL